MNATLHKKTYSFGHFFVTYRTDILFFMVIYYLIGILSGYYRDNKTHFHCGSVRLNPCLSITEYVNAYVFKKNIAKFITQQ